MLIHDVEIDSSGKVVSAKPSGNPLLGPAAAAAAKGWQFAPAADKSTKRTTTLIFVFKVMPYGSSVTDLGSIFYPPYKIEVRAEEPSPKP